MGLEDLPPYLLLKILQVGELDAADLARLEMSCYTFSAAGGLEPYRFKSLTENAALLYCESDPLFVRLSPTLQSQLVSRCGGNRKLVMRFLQATRQAATGVCTPTGKVQVVAGVYLTFLVKEGKLFGCGFNHHGVLGPGRMVVDCTSRVQMEVPIGCRVKQISGTHIHVAFVTEMGEVYTYGDNTAGCCGHGDIQRRIYKPTLVQSLSGIDCRQVSTGLHFTAALTREGGVYTWGSGLYGQLGHGDTVELSQPVLVDGLSAIGAVTQIATGSSYTMSLMDNGELYSFGHGGNYCLGHNDTANVWQPRQVVLDEKSFLTSVAAGDTHCVAIDSQGQVYTWGEGSSGALGHGATNKDNVRRPKAVDALRNVLAVQVSARRRRTFVVADTGQMFAFGWHVFGSMGQTTSEKVFSPIEVVGHAVAGQATEGKAAQHVSQVSAGYYQVSAGYYHTVWIRSDGSLLSFEDYEMRAFSHRGHSLDLIAFSDVTYFMRPALWLLRSFCIYHTAVVSHLVSRQMFTLHCWMLIC